MANLSSFPNSIDTFITHTELTSSDIPNVSRFQELKLKTSRTPAEETELASLTTLLRNKMMSADDFNKFQDALVNMEIFIRDNVEGYVIEKQGEITTTTDAALALIEQKKANVIAYMDSTTAGELRNDIGIMGDLTTTDKTSLVGAVNELDSELNSATPLATPDTLAKRDANGNVKSGTPIASDDVARKSEIDSLNTQLAEKAPNLGIATQAQAQAGTANTVYMTPQRTAQAIAALSPAPDVEWRIGTNGPEWSNDGGGSWNPVGDRLLNMTPNMINISFPSQSLAPNTPLSIFEYTGSGVLNELVLSVAASNTMGHRLLVDGVVMELFAKPNAANAATPLNAGGNLYNASASGAVILTLNSPIPFESSFSIQVINFGGSAAIVNNVAGRGVYYT